MSLPLVQRAPRHTERNPTAQRLIDAALESIERQGTVRGVNLRAISQIAGCAHTNAYNYFGSFEDLLWNALPVALDRLMSFTQNAMKNVRSPSRALEVFVASQVQFALEHPGLYRFIWLDRLEGTPPPWIAEAIAEPPRLFAEFLKNLSGGKLSSRQATLAMELMHAYLHGEICRAIGGRIPGIETDLPRRVASRAKDLWQWFLTDIHASAKGTRRQFRTP